MKSNDTLLFFRRKTLKTKLYLPILLFKNYVIVQMRAQTNIKQLVGNFIQH